jgi:CRP-like cAMP-binding protein
MFTPESAKLKIRPGNIYSEDNSLIYEVDATLQRVVLPFESQEVLELLLEKDRSISELVSEIKHRNGGRVSYRNLFFTTEKLLREGIVYSADAEAPPFYDDSNVRLVNGLTMDFVIFGKKSLPHAVRQKLFFGLCLAIILGGFYGLSCLFEEGVTSEFLLMKGRYDSGFFFALVFFSVLMSCKTLVLLGLNLTGMGRAYDLAVRVSPLSCALRIDDTYLYSSSRRMVAVFYGLASAFSYFFIAGIAKNFFLGEVTAPHVLTLAALLTLLDLNPLNGGELRKFAKSFVSEEDSEHLRPFYETQIIRSAFKFFSSTKKDKALFLYSQAVVLFCLFSMVVLIAIAYTNAPSLIDKISSEDMAQRAGAGIVMALLLVPFIYFCTDLINTVFKNVTGMNYGMVSHIKHKFGSKVLRLLDKNRLKDLIRTTPLFAAVGDNVLDYIMENGLVISYKEGTPIIQQGQKGTEIYLILTGSVQIQRREDSGLTRKLTDMGAGCVFGEMAVYGVEERTADVIAKEKVQAFVIRAEALLDLSRSADHQVQMQYVMDRIMITQYFMSQPFFAALPVELIQVFYSFGVVVDYESNKLVIQQGQQAEDFFLILRGSAFVEVNGQPVNTLNQGEFFGEIALLHDSRRTASIRTAVDTTLLKVPSHIFWKLALSNLEIAVYFESVAEKRLEEIQAPLAQAMAEAAAAASAKSEEQEVEPVLEIAAVEEEAVVQEEVDPQSEEPATDEVQEIVPVAIVSEDDSGDNSGTPAA